MAINLATTVRNQRLDAIETATGTSARLKIRSTAKPLSCGTADAGTVLADLQLPSDWLAAAASGSKAKAGTWQDTSADNTGTAGHFRIYKVGGSTCVLQGTVTTTAGGGDMTVANLSIASGQQVTVTSFTLTDGNA
jgi:hypothetical protein